MSTCRFVCFIEHIRAYLFIHVGVHVCMCIHESQLEYAQDQYMLVRSFSASLSLLHQGTT